MPSVVLHGGGGGGGGGGCVVVLVFFVVFFYNFAEVLSCVRFSLFLFQCVVVQ